MDYWSAGTVAGSKEYLGTVKKASPSRKQGCCSNTQLATVAVATVISPLSSSSILTERYVVVEQRSQQYIKHEQYQYRPQFLQHCMFFFSFGLKLLKRSCSYVCLDIQFPADVLVKFMIADEVGKKCNLSVLLQKFH